MDWLSWLARQMKKQAQSVFMVEELQPRWLDSTGQRLAYEAVTALSVGLIVTLAGEASAVLLGGLTELLLDCLKYGSIIGLSILLGCRSPSTVKNIAVSGLVFGLLVGLLGELLGGAANRIVGRLPDALAVTILTIRMLLIGLLGGIIGSLNEIRLIEIMRWQSTQFWRPMVSGSAIGLLLAGLLDVMNFLLTEHSDAFGGDKFWSFGFFGGLFGAVFGGLSDSVRVDKVSPNQGIRLSLKNGLVALSVSWLLFGLLFSLANEPRQAAVIGLVFGLGIGLSRGGSAVLKHYSLRLILWTTGATPLRFISFLDHCAKLIILKKVGGGYMFIHRTLLEYLSELPDRPRHTRF